MNTDPSRDFSRTTDGEIYPYEFELAESCNQSHIRLKRRNPKVLERRIITHVMIKPSFRGLSMFRGFASENELQTGARTDATSA